LAQLTQKGLVDSVGVTESRQYNNKTFVSRVLIIEQPRFDNYTGEKLGSNYIKFEATREDTCAALDNFPTGSKVEVEFIVRGTKYNKKDGSGEDVFTHLELRSISGVASTAQAPTSGASPIPAPAPTPAPAPAPAAPANSGPAQSNYDPDLGF
jgi:hypothetical protein